MFSMEVLRQRLAPFKSKSFRLLFGVQGVSLIGSWMQELAKSWIVLNLMGKASSMGLLMLASAVPNIALGSYGGVIADRSGAKRILFWTQVLLAVLALALGMLVSSGKIQFWHLLVFACLEGTVLSFDIPAMNIVTPQLVPKEDFQQALALNAVNFHLSRMLGPSIAGLVMGFAGPAAVFWMNGVSFVGVVWAVTRLPISKTGAMKKAGASTGEAFREAITYIRSNALLQAILLQFLLVIGLVFPLIFTTLRLYVQQRFHLSAKEFGLVFAAPGLGSLVGSLTFLVTSPKKPIRILPWGVAGVVLFLCLIPTGASLALTTAYMMGFSVSMFLTLSALLVTVQLMIDHSMRGRISALTGMAFAAFAPLMAAPMGYASDAVGAHDMLFIVAGLFGVLSLFVGMKGIRAEAPAQGD